MITVEDMEEARNKAIDSFLQSQACKDLTDSFEAFLLGVGVREILKRLAESIRRATDE